jgi:hypothetical protein
VPDAVDWDEDSVIDEQDEWIELYNAGSIAADIGGWSLDGGVASTTTYTIPKNTVLQPGAFVVLYRGETRIVLGDEGGIVRLLGPDGAVVDEVAYGILDADASYSLGAGSVWHRDWPPSPGTSNLPPGPTPVSRLSGYRLWVSERWPIGLLRAIDGF